LNIGARVSDRSSSYLLFTDVDILYPGNFLEEALNCLEFDNRRFVQCNLIPLPDSEFVLLDELNDSIPELIAKYGTQRNCWPGTCQAMQREWFFKVRGFDESFVGWGHEDTDLRIRAEKDRLNVVILSNTVILHQHHQSCRKELRETVNWAKIVSTHSTVRNGVNWGKIDR
jgi:GT2 family glycosyltransferase